ncbi:MAG: type II toxin-antitoxin system RelE/ParE family toxin [Elusimicrobia bacterium]|nr:type II toxin-antitoxin system RelE/ParE family toxin [Elusimicrobiota bacterium]
MSWLHIEFLPSAAADFRALPADIKSRVSLSLDIIGRDPNAGKPLQGPYSGLRSFPVGDYRVVYRWDARYWLVIVQCIGHRRDIDR